MKRPDGEGRDGGPPRASAPTVETDVDEDRRATQRSPLRGDGIRFAGTSSGASRHLPRARGRLWRFVKRPYGVDVTSARDGGRGKPLPYGRELTLARIAGRRGRRPLRWRRTLTRIGGRHKGRPYGGTGSASRGPHPALRASFPVRGEGRGVLSDCTFPVMSSLRKKNPRRRARGARPDCGDSRSGDAPPGSFCKSRCIPGGP